MIHIVQCLCPDRHCIVAVAYDAGDMTPEHASLGLAGLLAECLARREIDPWCAICGSEEWHYEDGATRFRTLEEARPHLEACQAEQMLARELLAGGRPRGRGETPGNAPGAH